MSMKRVGGLDHKILCDSYSYSQEIHSQVPESNMAGAWSYILMTTI